jgi:two-component system, cell cycle sensor histidine kinase and response regulator CckA
MSQGAPKILIVDDTPNGRKVLKSALANSGFHLSFAENGGEALAMAAELLPDLVLLDVMMPGMDGFEVCRRIRADPVLSDLPVVMVTALTDRDSRLRGIEAGADDFVSKPYDVLELRSRVRNIVRLNRFRRMGEAREKYERMFRLAPFGIMVIGADRVIREANPALVSFLKADAPTQIIGVEDLVFIAPESLSGWNEFMERVMGDDGTTSAFRTETRFLPIDDCPLIAEVDACRLDWRDGPAVQLAVRDVTEKREFEKKVFQAQRVETIGMLAGGIAHDLNNILTPVLLGIEIIRPNVPEADRLMLEVMESSARRGSGMVKQVLAFARGSGSPKGDVQLRRIMSDIRMLARETFPSRIVIREPPMEGNWVVRGDAAQISQVALNLCVNARDAMAGNGELTLTTRNTLVDEAFLLEHATGFTVRPGRFVVISVSDTGEGIPPEVLPRIFTPFFSTKGPEKGTGIGLSTVRTIVVNHGGFLTVRSDVGRGTEIEVFFPAEGGDGIPEQVDSGDLPRGNGERILLADDEASLCRLVAATLEAYGYRVHVCSHGAEAIAVFESAPNEFAAALIDLQMPLIDGQEVIRNLRSLSETIHIIALTGTPSKELTEAARLAGAMQILTKPFSTHDLLVALASGLNPSPDSILGDE